MDSGENEQKLIFSGRTIEEALQNAREKLGLDPYTQLSYKVIEDTTRKKFLLFGSQKKEIRIQIHFTQSDIPEDGSLEQPRDVKQRVADVWNTGRERAPRERRENKRYEKGAEERNNVRGQGRSQSGTPRRSQKEGDSFRTARKAAAPSGGFPPIGDNGIALIRDHMNTLFNKMGLNLTVEVERSVKNPSIVRITPQGEDGAWLYQQKDSVLWCLEELILKMLRIRLNEEQKCQLYFVGLKTKKPGSDVRGFSSREPSTKLEEPSETLKQDIQASIEHALVSGEPVTVGPHNSMERRYIHQEAAAAGLQSESHGEGAQKMVTLKKQT